MSENKKLNEQIAQDFYNNFKGKLEDEQLDQVVQEIKCTENKYHTQGSLICAVFYFRVTVGGYGDVKKQFTGNGGGGGLPGAQALIGDLYTSDLERLYRDTDSFQFTVRYIQASCSLIRVPVCWDTIRRGRFPLRPAVLAVVKGVGNK